jgi:methylglutaconyl-CoA hydratase
MHPILIHDNGPIRTITLNRPSHRNALTPEMQHYFIEAIDTVAETKSVRVLVLTGTGDAFCAGLDLTTLQDFDPESLGSSETSLQLADTAHRLARILRSLHELPIPVIAAVNGHAIAGGTGLATVCDFTLAVPAAKFGYTEPRIGFVPALVSAYLSLQLGDKRVRDLLLTGRLFSAEEACQLGLVTEVVAPEDLFTRVLSLSETLLANSPTSLRDTKALLAAQHRPWLDRAVDLALKASAASRRTPDFREGVTAFLEKRKPTWST